MGSLNKLAAVLCALLSLSVITANAHSAPDLLFSYHFVGTASLGTNTNAAKLKQILELPESIKLRDEVLQKLARTPEQFLTGNGDRESETARLIRPLLENLMAVESLAEVRRASNGFGEIVIAVRLKKDQLALWDANLQKIVSHLGKAKSQKTKWEKFEGWEVKRDTSPNLVRSVWTGDWLVLGIGGSELPLQNNMLRRLATAKAPVDWKGATNWFEAIVDFPRLKNWLPLDQVPFKLAKTEISVTSRDGTMRSTVRATYPAALNWKFQKWQVPTNIIRDPLVSFSAAQDISVLLNNPGWLDRTGINPLTSQFFVWAFPQLPLMTYAAMPVKDSVRTMEGLADRLPQLYNPKLQEAKAGKLVVSTNRQSILWSGISMIAPTLKATNEVAGDFIFASVFPPVPSNEPPPRELLDQFLPRTNLIFYDWEVAQERLIPWQMMTKAIPALGPKRQAIPPEMFAEAKTNAAVRLKLSGLFLDQRWQGKVAPLLNNTTTEVTLVAPNEVQLLRKSDIGFSSLELIYVSHWLNHPDFPLFRRAKTSVK